MDDVSIPFLSPWATHAIAVARLSDRLTQLDSAMTLARTIIDKLLEAEATPLAPGTSYSDRPADLEILQRIITSASLVHANATDSLERAQQAENWLMKEGKLPSDHPWGRHKETLKGFVDRKRRTVESRLACLRAKMGGPNTA